MAEFGYLNIGYTGYTGYTDDSNKKTYGESDYFDPASCPTIFEAKRRKKPTSPPKKPERPPPTSDDKWRRRWPPSGHRPQRGEEFISNAEVEIGETYIAQPSFMLG
ncbi:hypothetical protein CsSME_00023447 [Camellia sinensis var. sinensis]